MDKLVEDTEAFCDAIEKIPMSITDRIAIGRFTADPIYVSVAATIANVRMFYYVTVNNNPEYATVRGFEQFKWLLTDGNSSWETLTDDEKISLLRQTREIFNEVFIFV